MNGPVGAVVLAAGQSRRMGQPKLVLPWGNRTVIEQVVSTLLEAGVTEIVVVTGGAAEQVAAALARYPVRLVQNPAYAASEMLDSLQIGIAALPEAVRALLVVPGDQPSIPAAVVQAVIAAFSDEHAPLVVPSYQQRRGHPWLVARALWPEMLALQSGQTLRDFLNHHAARIHYVTVDSPGILQDLDTPEDYAAQRPQRPS